MLKVLSAVGGTGAIILIVISKCNKFILDRLFGRALRTLVQKKLGLKSESAAKQKMDQIYSYEGMLERSSALQ